MKRLLRDAIAIALGALAQLTCALLGCAGPTSDADGSHLGDGPQPQSMNTQQAATQLPDVIVTKLSYATGHSPRPC